MDTRTIQKLITKTMQQMELNVGRPTAEMKRQYAKVEKLFIDLLLELDELNTLMDQPRVRD